MGKKASVVLLVAVLMMCAGCVDADSTLLIDVHVPYVGTVETETVMVDGEEVEVDRLVDCTGVESLDDVGLKFSSAVWNLQDGPLSLGILMENQLAPSTTYAPIGEDSELRVDKNHIELDRIEFTFESGGGGFSRAFDGGDTVVYPYGGIVTTEGGLHSAHSVASARNMGSFEDAVSTDTDGTDQIVPVFAEIQVFGETIAGNRVESNVIRFPLEICDGCAFGTTPLCVEGN